jgi:L-lactate dehydrogenase complex protein LldG
MNSKNTILNNIKKASVTPVSHPSLDISRTKFKNKDEKFASTLKSVGGIASWLGNDESIEDFVQKSYSDLGLIATNLDLKIDHINANDIDDPHALKDIDLAIIQGEFAVAENGAVWIMENGNLNRAIYFIARKLLIILSKGEIVDSMHEAYKKIKFKKSGFGTFISGPSKTADIEQALVIGAHGAMACRVLLI